MDVQLQKGLQKKHTHHTREKMTPMQKKKKEKKKEKSINNPLGQVPSTMHSRCGLHTAARLPLLTRRRCIDLFSATSHAALLFTWLLDFSAGAFFWHPAAAAGPGELPPPLFFFRSGTEEAGMRK